MWYVCDQSLIYYEPSILGWIRSKPLMYWVPLIKSEPLIISFVIQSHPSIQILLMMQSQPLIYLWLDPNPWISPPHLPNGIKAASLSSNEKESLFLSPRERQKKLSPPLHFPSQMQLTPLRKFFEKKDYSEREKRVGAGGWSRAAPSHPLQAANFRLERMEWRCRPPSWGAGSLSLLAAC